MEEELGYPLLNRNNKGFQFTAEGTKVLEKAHLILHEVESIQRLERAEAEPEGTLHIGSTPHFCNSILLDVMLKIEGRYPRVSLLLEESDSENVIKQIEAGVLQMGLVQLCDVENDFLLERVIQRSILLEELFEEEMCVVVGEHHPLADRAQIVLKELMQYSYATYRDAMNTRVKAFLDRYQGRIAHISEIVSLRQFIMRTNSYTVIPRRAILHGNIIYQEKLVPLPVPELTWNSKIGLVRPNNEMTVLEKTVRDELLARCKAYQN